MRHLVRATENVVNIYISTNCYSFYLTLRNAKYFKHSKWWKGIEQFARRRKGTSSKYSKKEANRNFLNFLWGITTADFASEKMDDTNVDEDKCFLLSLLPSFRQFNDEQNFLDLMEILKIMRHIKLQHNLNRYSSCALPSFSNANSFLPNSSHFASNPRPVTSIQNSEILSRYLSNYSVQLQRPPTSTTVLP